MNGWDGVRAWRLIRASKGYRTAWKRRVPQPGLTKIGDSIVQDLDLGG